MAIASAVSLSRLFHCGIVQGKRTFHAHAKMHLNLFFWLLLAREFDSLVCVQLKDMKAIGLRRHRSVPFDGRTSTATTSFASTKHTETQANAAAVGDQFSASSQQRASVPGDHTVDHNVHFTFTAGALAAMARKSRSTVDEDNQNV